MTLEQVFGGFDLCGKGCLHVNTGDDEYVGCIVDGDDVGDMIAMACKAVITVALRSFFMPAPRAQLLEVSRMCVLRRPFGRRIRALAFGKKGPV
ncbi:hypothetical protein L6218_18840 [Pseudomonas syringae pv. syringae]|uniref:hypothetical protein n=1 Tax=Pseudomonas TaxID=286 RepID=UPI000CD1A70C|nr:hypothetical protein [Pseudomonas syringae]MCF4984453.1 hypothetical protein [Pseudomonas syringae]MCF5203413.1 hypothetical protein [Pseudomonas syringae]MCF5271556.1 hypothetical protein [Pseudomonas syringae]MCF5274585.1 hypothetical protein [Pseudomonas syringae]MCF5280016.1 hypothetical protein [Pseudomonas syringae]